MLKIFAAFVLVTATNRFSSILPEATPFWKLKKKRCKKAHIRTATPRDCGFEPICGRWRAKKNYMRASCQTQSRSFRIQPPLLADFQLLQLSTDFGPGLANIGTSRPISGKAPSSQVAWLKMVLFIRGTVLDSCRTDRVFSDGVKGALRVPTQSWI